MKTYLDCFPCFCRQALEAVKLATDDEMVRANVMREVFRALGNMDMGLPPPEMGAVIHGLVRKITGVNDPYQSVKDRSNRLALQMYPQLKRKAERSANPGETALRMAIAGNVIDFGANGARADALVRKALEESLSEPLAGAEPGELLEAASGAKDILYLTDNAGEIVFDRLFIEWLGCHKVTVVVRGAPVINDATMRDAEAAGLTDIVEVMDNGSDAPGTLLGRCSDEFRRRFDSAGLVIAKGQGNYETLSDVGREVFFLLKVKCPVVAGDIGCNVGNAVLLRHGGK